jgi:hypothetical protein
MRREADAARTRAFLAELSRHTREPTTLYLVGGATAVLEGWRSTTIDVDLLIEPERDELLRALPEIKDRLMINVELASPLDFLPELPGWRERSQFVDQLGALTVRHFDFYAQALAKMERDLGPDTADVQAMIRFGRVEPPRLRELFEAIAPELHRFPTVDGDALRKALAQL